MNLKNKIINIKGVGELTAKKLLKLDITTIQSLLFFFPFKLISYTNVNDLKNSAENDNIIIKGEILLIDSRKARTRKLSITECLVKTKVDEIKVVWFNQPFVQNNLQIGDEVLFWGKITVKNEEAILNSPFYQKIDKNKNLQEKKIFIPKYHLTKGISQKQLRNIIKKIEPLICKITDWVPDNIIKSNNLFDLKDALKNIHFPTDDKLFLKAQKRFAFEELFLLQLNSLLIKRMLKNKKSSQITFKQKTTSLFTSNLPFKMTDSQKKCSWEILKDLSKDVPMSRLLQGDVGSGKTIVASLAILNTALNKKQVAFMAPTEILAKQHFETIIKLFSPQKFKIVLLTSSLRLANVSIKITRNEVENKIKEGFFDIVIGTHSLLEKKIEFKNLALVVVDEQHKFGVEQRKNIVSKHSDNKTPHYLSMSATPIPRSLALALHGDLDISTIDEMPKDRLPVITKQIKNEKYGDLYKFVKEKIDNKEQCFVICPLIDASDKLGAKSVKEEYEKLSKIFKGVAVDFIHGKMKTGEKELKMADFKKNKTKILVATSVIEVGIDIPNASIIIIEGADRFGLAQLHQFRGRVGRSKLQSYCFLLSESNSQKTQERISSLEKYNNGFDLAKIDLQFRGPGEIYGQEQKGFPELKIASLFDYTLIKKTRSEAEALIKKDPLFLEHPLLKEKVDNISESIHLE